MPKLTQGNMNRIPIMAPPLADQERIAEILGSLDDKIDLNRRMNETLEAMARAIFRSWFVDFDPVRAKMEGRQPVGMDPETASLFPDSFEDSAIGLAPKGWKTGVPSDVCQIAVGGDWGEDAQFEGALEVLCLRGVDLEHLRQSGSASPPRRWVTPSSYQKRQVSDQDVLIAASGAGPCGRPIWVSPELQKSFLLPVTYSNFCKRFRAKSPAHAVYLDRVLHEMRESNEIWEYVNGTSVPNLDATGLLSARPLLLPPLTLLERFSTLVKPIYSKLYSSESRILADIRDALMPKLLSGEIRLRDAEKTVEAHT